jgi:transcriptional accessory protein Tex/SPT6
LRIAESENILDNTDIHPEQYALAHYIIENQLKDTDFDTHKEKLVELYPGLDRQTLHFIITAYQMR